MASRPFRSLSSLSCRRHVRVEEEVAGSLVGEGGHIATVADLCSISRGGILVGVVSFEEGRGRNYAKGMVNLFVYSALSDVIALILRVENRALADPLIMLMRVLVFGTV